MALQITLEQWRSLIAVVETGGYVQAAESLHKSQSALTYAVQKIESQLNVKVFEIQGRKAMLTPIGHMLYRRAQALVDEALNLEQAAHTLSAGWEAEIRLAVEILFPTRLLVTCLERFNLESPHTRIELIESVLGGTTDALQNGEVDLVISPQQPPGFLGELLTRIHLLAVAHADHPLHHYGRELTQHDLRAYRHIVVRDSGLKRDRRAVTIEIDQRWTVSQIATSITAVSMGYGFAWLPVEHIQPQLDSGILKPLALREGGTLEIPLYLILANPDLIGPGLKHLVAVFKDAVTEKSR